LVRVRDNGLLALGLLFVFPTVYLIVSSYSISFVNFYFLLTGLFLIFNSVLEHKTASLSIIFSFILLLAVFIAIMNLNIYPWSKESLISIITGVTFLIRGIIIYLGYLSEK